MLAMLILQHVWQGHQGAVLSVAHHPHADLIASGGEDGAICLWTSGDAHPLWRQRPPGERVGCGALLFVPSRNWLLSGTEEGSIWVWESRTGHRVGRWPVAHSAEVRALALSPDGRWLASGSADALVLLCELDSGTATSKLAQADTVCALAWTPSSQALFTAGQDGRLCVFEVPSGRLLRVLLQQQEWLMSLACSPDGQRLACGLEESTGLVLEVATGNLYGWLTGPSNQLTGLAWSPDGSLLVGGGAEGTLQVWEAATRRLLVSQARGSRGITSLACAAPRFQAGTCQVVTAHQEGEICQWRLDVDV
ncbi:MAG TPA: WD40 repeat domain-containing protein [Ktedonobacterales bacterium]|jgi:WD40 repeat protein